MKQIPFRYPDEVEADLKDIIKSVFSWGGSKNKVITLAVRYLAAFIRKVKKKNPKIKSWDLKEQLEEMISERRSRK